MYYMGKDWRNKNNINMFDPRQYNMESYYTSSHYKKEMKHSFGDELLSNLHLLPDPLKKNLADSIITTEEKEKKTDKMCLNTLLETESPKMENSANHNMPTFGGITNFFSGVLNVISGAMANWRPKSPAQYYDCFDDSVSQGAPLSWHGSNNEVQNKSARENHLNSKSDMNIDCKTAAAQCEDKLNKVRVLLTTKPIETPKFRARRPRKAFVEAGSVEDSFEDAFSPEDFSCVSNDTHIECYSPYQIHNKVLSETAAPKVKIETIVNENTDIIKTLPEMTVEPEVISKKSEEMGKSTENKMMKEIIETKVVDTIVEVTEDEKSSRQELVSSCEDKLLKLKVLLQEKRKKNIPNPPSPDSNTETVAMSNEKHTKPPRPHNKSKDKRYKNPCRINDKRKKSRVRKSIQDDLVFAQEINGEDLSSAENSPSINSLDRLSDIVNPIKGHTNPKSSPVQYFDEVNGRFRSTSTTESEDSFQIVFNDSPKETRMRKISDCDSEDSFIVFEDTPDSCYTSNDVFGDSDESGSDYTDSELSDMDIQVSKLSHNLSRTISDLTDSSLYEDNAVDEVDCAVQSVCDEIPNQEISDLSVKVPGDVEPKPTGLLLNEEKKLLKRQQPPKSVHFSPHPPKVHVMRVWAFAARQARAGHWERCALDRDRFKRRIADVDMAVSWVLKPQHRSRVMFQRFMPWWNAQRRKELAEKKEREERIKEEKRQEEERIKEEAERLKQENEDNGNVSPDIILINDKKQEHINNSEHNDVPNNDKGSETSDIVLINDKEQKQINDTGNNDVLNNDTAVIVNDKLKNLKLNGIIKKYKLNKSQLNSTKIVPVNDKNKFTTKLRSEGLSST